MRGQSRWFKYGWVKSENYLEINLISLSSAKEQSNQEIKREYKGVYAFQYKSNNTVIMEIFHVIFEISIFF